MKLSDYVAQFLADQGIKHAFVVSGGAAVHLVDSIARNPNIDYICVQHEESGAMAADAYARVTGNLGAAITTSGPGATNLLTGVCCSFFDSIPTFFVTGQVATFRLKRSETIRQIGFQETDVVSIFKSVTKYCVLVRDPQEIKFHLQKAAYLAKAGRPGPVLIDLPDDLQRAEIDPDKQKSFIPEIEEADEEEMRKSFLQCNELIAKGERPVFMFGAGIVIARAEDLARELVEKTQIPFLLTWGAMDVWPYSHPLNIGGFGVCGPRAGNFAVQNSDLIIAIGTRLSQMLTGGRLEHFGRAAKKIVVDIDGEELRKFEGRGLQIDAPIRSEIRTFLKRSNDLLSDYAPKAYVDWLKVIEKWKREFPICSPQYYEMRKEVDAYVFIDALSEECKEGDIIITDAGGNLTWTMQAFKVKRNQRVFSAWNHSPMGYSLPAAYGASFADRGKQIICIIGDGGLQMCIEELATVARHDLPIKIFLFNNRGHGIQKQTLDTWFSSRYEAVDYPTGLYFPDFIKVAEAYGIAAVTIASHEHLNEKIREILQCRGPVLCNVEINPGQKIQPMLTFGRPLEDQEPLLERKQFLENMLIEPVTESLK